MPCDTRLRDGVTLEQRGRQIETALQRLERALAAGQVQIAIGPTGSIAFRGQWERDDVSDVCAYRMLTARSSSALRMSLARAEATSGRRVNPMAVAAGHHSHDGGGSWHGGH